MTGRLQPWLPALAWGVLIFVLSSRPTVPVPLGMGLDKLAHFLTYAVLGALLARAGRGSSVPAPVCVAIGLLYGASDEWHQSFVPGRAADAADWLADAAGVLAGFSLDHRARRRAERLRPPRAVHVNPTSTAP